MARLGRHNDTKMQEPEHRITPVLRVGPLTNVPQVLLDLGCSPRPLFAAMQLDQASFKDPDTEISYLAASKLLSRCVAATGCPYFGLLVGQQASPSSLGVPGYLLRSAPDVLTALNDFIHCFDLHDRGGIVRLRVGEAASTFGYFIDHPNVEGSDQVYDLSMAVACNIMRGLCGEGWKPTRVYLSHPSPQDTEPFRRFFRSALSFDADESLLAFPTQWLHQPLPGADLLLHRHFLDMAEQLHVSKPETLAGQLRRLVRASLGRRPLEASGMASQLGMHQRTLHRRLREEGTSFRREVDAVRYELACQLLADSANSLRTVAAMLDYADDTAFIRAFVRWSGTTPSAWRQSAAATREIG